uniref:Uncharacterized protein n=1 Tax=Knipowitschia caucasica TaxID=637954 RepID=A0AAV2KDS7_KNICA
MVSPSHAREGRCGCLGLVFNHSVPSKNPKGSHLEVHRVPCGPVFAVIFLGLLHCYLAAFMIQEEFGGQVTGLSETRLDPAVREGEWGQGYSLGQQRTLPQLKVLPVTLCYAKAKEDTQAHPKISIHSTSLDTFEGCGYKEEEFAYIFPNKIIVLPRDSFTP